MPQRRAAERMSRRYMVGIVQYVDDASLNQIVKAISKELNKRALRLE